mgnify:CR=1 FL=1
MVCKSYQEITQYAARIYVIYCHRINKHSWIYSKIQYYMKIIVGMGAVLAIASLCVQKYTTKYLFLVVALFALFLIEIKITKKTTLMLTLLLLIAAKGIAQRKILATFLIAKLSGLF